MLKYQIGFTPSTNCEPKDLTMEVEESERIVIAKPVPTRPTCASFRSFSELLAGAINSSPTNACSEAAVSAIRPKTVRFKPIINRAPVGLLSSQAEVSGAAICYPSHEDKVLNSDSKSNVVYKPLAKVVSKTTLRLLANLGNSNISHQQNFPSKLEREKTIESSKMASGIMEDDQKYLSLPNNGDRSSYDGYNWRKYGQKQVKGSDYPRSYYKCTHPNCPVKKKVERSLDGQIAEIVYKGEHNHSKPQPIRRNTLQETNNPSSSDQINEKNEGCEVRTENQNEVGLLGRSTYSSKQLLSYDRLASGVGNIDTRTSENSCGLSGDCEEESKGLEAEADEPRSKRRKNENEPGISGEGVQEPGVLVQSSLDSETKGDGFRWRKYGQKVVKGNPYPRSYYRCTNTKCNVRKHVERASEDPKAFITTYEGKHNHDMPVKNTNQAASEPDPQAAISKDKP